MTSNKIYALIIKKQPEAYLESIINIFHKEQMIAHAGPRRY